MLHEVSLQDLESAGLRPRERLRRVRDDDHLSWRRTAQRRLPVVESSSRVAWNARDPQDQLAVPAVLDRDSPDGPHLPDRAVLISHEVLHRPPLRAEVDARVPARLGIRLLSRPRAPGHHLLAELDQLGLPSVAAQAPVRRHAVVAHAGAGQELGRVLHEPLVDGLLDRDRADSSSQRAEHGPDVVLHVPDGFLGGAVRLMVVGRRVGRRYAQGTHTARLVNDVLHEGALGRLAVRLKDALAHS